MRLVLFECLLALFDVRVYFVNRLLNLFDLGRFLLDKLRIAFDSNWLLVLLITECIFFEDCFLVVLFHAFNCILHLLLLLISLLNGLLLSSLCHISRLPCFLSLLCLLLVIFLLLLLVLSLLQFFFGSGGHLGHAFFFISAAR